jgi:hypothetical protein
MKKYLAPPNGTVVGYVPRKLTISDNYSAIARVDQLLNEAHPSKALLTVIVGDCRMMLDTKYYLL